MSDYKWRWCSICHQRIFRDEVEGDTIMTVDNEVYCIDCANDIKEANANE